MKNYKKVCLAAGLCLVAMFGRAQSGAEQEIAVMMDGWHKAAADADFNAYFGGFENDESIFLGTDATERWTTTEFKAYCKPHFERGQAWSFVATERFFYFSDNGKVAWVEEVLDTPHMGPCRGTAVLKKTKNGWKIAHYNLTVPIPNAIMGNVVQQIATVLAAQAEDE